MRMSLERSAHRSYLKSEYERYRRAAEKARNEGRYRQAGRYYRQCVSIVEDLADLESSDRLTEERRELARNFEMAAERLEAGDPIESDVSDESTETSRSVDGSPAGDRSKRNSTGSSQGATPKDDDSQPDPSQYLSPPPERSFGDVGGMTDLKETLKDQVIDPLERPELYEEYGLGVVNAVLLYGPPGTGKTYVTEALAGELGYNFVEAQVADVTSSLVGEAADNVAELFEVARNNQPCLLFLDEIEGIAAERSGGSQKTMSESQMITQFLSEMSEIKGKDVVVVSATNLPDELDGAAWRRFDERIEVPPPDATARAAILRVHLREPPVLTQEIEWDRITSLTDGYTASDLEMIASDAARRALKEASEAGEVVPIDQQHIETAIERTESSLKAWDGGDS